MLISPLTPPGPPRLTDHSTSYGDHVRFQAPCPCGGGSSWWHVKRADTALSKPEYDIRCNHEENPA